MAEPGDRVSTALWSAKLSQRGAIRRPYNVVTWAGVIRQLKASGVDDPANVIKRWNDTAGLTTENRIVGGKRTALLNLLALSPETLNAFMAIVSEFTWEACPFTEEFLGSAKLKVGATIRCQNKEWIARFRVTEKSLHLFCDFLRSRYQRMAVNNRRKMSKPDLEDTLLCCFCCSCCQSSSSSRLL